jgi:hypothetical protein
VCASDPALRQRLEARFTAQGQSDPLPATQAEAVRLASDAAAGQI